METATKSIISNARKHASHSQLTGFGSSVSLNYYYYKYAFYAIVLVVAIGITYVYSMRAINYLKSFLPNRKLGPQIRTEDLNTATISYGGYQYTKNDENEYVLRSTPFFNLNNGVWKKFIDFYKSKYFMWFVAVLAIFIVPSWYEYGFPSFLCWFVFTMLSLVVSFLIVEAKLLGI